MWPATATASDRRGPSRWTTGAKDGVGTSASARSSVWFTLAQGSISEVYYPTIDRANTRRVLLAVVSGDRVYIDGDDGVAPPVVAPLAPWIPGYEVRVACFDDGLTLHSTIITDVDRPVVLQRVRITGRTDPIRVYALVEPHLDNQGEDNDGWLGDYKGLRAAFVERGSAALALLCSRSFCDGTCTFTGAEAAVADLRANHALTVHRQTAPSGDLQLAVEIDLGEENEFVLALGFGETPDDAAQQAGASLYEGFDVLCDRFRAEWDEEHDEREEREERDKVVARVHAVSGSMLRVHEDKMHPGATIASLAIPWGNAHGDHARGGYHYAWPRDLVEAAGASLALDRPERTRRSLLYLMSTQEHTGSWPQFMWLDGSAHGHNTQLDEVALPILLARAVADRTGLDGLEPWKMVRAAADFLVRRGPSTPQDRWEESGGYSPYTIAVEVAALLAAATFADEEGEPGLAAHLRATADDWDSSIDRWMYVTDTATARRCGVEGYYVRLAPPEAFDHGKGPAHSVPLRIPNQRRRDRDIPYEEIVSPDALALVRFGLRAADDERMVNTVTVIDAELRTETARGPVWHRYTHDGYGETPDGQPHTAWGVGRGWPLLTGERAHFEIAAGRLDAARELYRAMASQASDTGLLSEQVWDADDLPDHQLFSGRPTGSAMPLVWAHAEFLKLGRSLRDERVFDLPLETVERYAAEL